MRRVREEESADGNNNVHHDAETTLQVVRLAVTKEGADHKNGKHEGNSVEDGEVVVHVWNHKAPADEDDERGVEQCSLNRCTHDVSHGHIDLVVVGFVDGEEMLYQNCQQRSITIRIHRRTSNLLNKGNENETHEGITDATMNDHVLNLLYQEDGNQ